MNLGGTVHINKTGCCVLLGALIILSLYIFSSRSMQTEGIVSHINLRKLLAVAIQAAEDGGKVVVATRKHLKIDSKGKTKEGANDSVTTADYQSHCIMMRLLKHSFPTLEVISEEAKTVCNEDKNADFTESEPAEPDISNDWVNEQDVKVWIDPLDATQEYTEGLYQYVTTMVCVAVRGEPLIGVIHKPFSKETSWAWVGKGHSLNLKEPEETHKDKLKFIVSLSHTGQAKELIKTMFKDQNIEIMTAGGAGYKALEVANGNADVYLHVTTIKKWDICAGNAILSALRGRMTTKLNTPINYADSANPLNEDGLVATLKNQDVYLSRL